MKIKFIANLPFTSWVVPLGTGLRSHRSPPESEAMFSGETKGGRSHQNHLQRQDKWNLVIFHFERPYKWVCVVNFLAAVETFLSGRVAQMDSGWSNEKNNCLSTVCLLNTTSLADKWLVGEIIVCRQMKTIKIFEKFLFNPSNNSSSCVSWSSDLSNKTWQITNTVMLSHTIYVFSVIVDKIRYIMQQVQVKCLETRHLPCFFFVCFLR